MVSFPGLTHDANTPTAHKIHPLNTLPKIIYSNIKQNNICQENKTKKGWWIEYFSILIPKALHQKPREHHSWPRSWNTSRFSVGKTILGMNFFFFIYKLLQFYESSLARKIIPAWLRLIRFHQCFYVTVTINSNSLSKIQSARVSSSCNIQ